MTVNLKSLQIERLSIAERLDLVEALWDSVASSAALTEAQRDELDRRLADHRQHPDDVAPWHEVKTSISARIKS
jgi:putative addiction module component (TIGR02574 family)